jgi:maltooligosyltrehalose trehalohydrolase
VHWVLWAFYKRLLQLRKNVPVLHQTGAFPMDVEGDETKKCMWIRRWHPEGSCLLVFNFSSQPQTFAIETEEKWFLQFSSAEVQWMGPGSHVPLAWALKTTMELMPKSFAVYLKEF